MDNGASPHEFRDWYRCPPKQKYSGVPLWFPNPQPLILAFFTNFLISNNNFTEIGQITTKSKFPRSLLDLWPNARENGSKFCFQTNEQDNNWCQSESLVTPKMFIFVRNLVYLQNHLLVGLQLFEPINWNLLKLFTIFTFKGTILDGSGR